MRVAVIYYSQTGNTKKMAEAIVKGIRSEENMEAEAFSIDEITQDYMNDCQGVIVGTPTYYGTLCGAIKVWLEKTTGLFDLSGKMAGAFATAAYVHGGGDIAIQSVLGHLLINGTLIYSSGRAFGNPVIHQGPVAIDSDLESYEELFEIYGSRFAKAMRMYLK